MMWLIAPPAMMQLHHLLADWLVIMSIRTGSHLRLLGTNFGHGRSLLTVMPYCTSHSPYAPLSSHAGAKTQRSLFRG